MNVLTYTKDSPFRAPYWRWERARRTIYDNRYSLRYEDAYVIQARAFQKAYRRCQDDFALEALARKYNSLYTAYEIHNDSNRDNIRYELQARLLTESSPAEIAQRLAVSTDTINDYERIFFNVRDRLQNKGYITHVVVGKELHQGLREHHYGTLWKIFALSGGKLALDAVIDRTYNLARPDDPNQLRSYFEDDAIQVVALKAAIAARVMPIDYHSAPILLEILQKYQELRNNAGSESGANLVVDNIKMMLEGIPWTTGASITMHTSTGITIGELPASIQTIDSHAAEARADDLLSIELGQETTMGKRLAQLTFPEKKDNHESALK